MNEPRFYVVELSCLPIGRHSGGWETEYLLLDRAYCHRVVGTFNSFGGAGAPPKRFGTRKMARLGAEREAARLNAWDAAA